MSSPAMTGNKLNTGVGVGNKEKLGKCYLQQREDSGEEGTRFYK